MECIICNRNMKYIGNNSSFPESKVYQCNKCEFALTNPLPTSDQIKEFYESGFYVKDTNLSGLEQRLQFSEKRAVSQFNFIKDSLPKPSSRIKALELGCSEGSLLILLEKYGFQVTAYEPDIKMAKLANERLMNENSKVLNQLFSEEELGVENYYDLICSSHVFEHIAQPNSHLNSIKKALKKNGCLFLEIPNQYALKNFVGSHATKHGHLYCYSPQSIQELLKNNGFKVITLKTCGKSAKEVKGSRNKSNKSYLGKMLTKIGNKIHKKISAFHSESVTSKNTQIPFEQYWDNQGIQGQWIRVLATVNSSDF